MSPPTITFNDLVANGLIASKVLCPETHPRLLGLASPIGLYVQQPSTRTQQSNCPYTEHQLVSDRTNDILIRSSIVVAPSKSRKRRPATRRTVRSAKRPAKRPAKRRTTLKSPKTKK